MVGENCHIGSGAILHGRLIGDNAVIGMGAVLGRWFEIGKWAIIAKGSVVKMRRKISAQAVAAGNPARVARAINGKDRELWNRGKQIHIDLAKK